MVPIQLCRFILFVRLHDRRPRTRRGLENNLPVRLVDPPHKQSSPFVHEFQVLTEVHGERRVFEPRTFKEAVLGFYSHEVEIFAGYQALEFAAQALHKLCETFGFGAVGFCEVDPAPKIEIAQVDTYWGSSMLASTAANY